MRHRDATAGERLERLLEFQTLLARVSREIGPALELQPVLAIVLRAMRSLVSFRGGTVQLVEAGVLTIAAADPPVSPEMASARVPVGAGLGGQVVSSGRFVYSEDVQRDERISDDLRRSGVGAGMRSYLGVPLVCFGRVIGLVQIDSAEPDAFDSDDLHVLEGLATQVAGAIESARHNEQVMELERLKSDFLARVSHELRTPLTITSGFINTLIGYDDRIDGRQRMQMLRRIQSATDRLEALIDELLTVTQFEAGALEPQPHVIDLRDLLHEVRGRAVEPELVAVRCPDGLQLTVDPRLLRHALTLLLDNALKYAGDAELRAGVDDGGRVVVEVTDHGPGVPPELGERVFERFMRGDHTAPGMGLGLPLVRTLAIGLMAGVTLEDMPGGGACFRLTFV
ncbi:MAG: two-component system, OmpR family, phosphate regulon sensor histidine kinase PhoR [Actinomycetota bacterium]|jgi:signal transduction histidine kinase